MSARERGPSGTEAEEARSTARPPSTSEDGGDDLAAAIRATRQNPSPGRYGPPSATAKIAPFQLAEALALSTADKAPSSRLLVPETPEAASPSSVPAAAYAAVTVAPKPLVEEAAAGAATAPPPAIPAEHASAETDPEPAPAALVTSDDEAAAEDGGTTRRPFSPLVLFALALGVAMLVYAYLVSNR